MSAVEGAPVTPRKPIVVVGAGIVGTCIAYALVKRGHAVTLVDRDAPGMGASFGNSGAISPGSVVPLATPGILAQVPAMLARPDSPLHLPWRYLPRAAPWLARFAASSQRDRYRQSVERLAALHRGAVAAHRALTREVGVPELFLARGHLHLYRDARALDADAEAWRLRAAHGHAAERLDRGGIEALEPGAPRGYGAGMFLADHASIVNPWRYVQAIAAAFTARGGVVQRDAVRRLRREGDGWRVEGETRSLSCATVVVAAGAWARALLDPLGVHLALESQRGYHVQFRGASPVTRTVVLADRKVFCTPMEQGLRVGGTVEIGGLAAPPTPARAALLARIATEAFADLRADRATTWMGHRPCMPDSVPVIGGVDDHPGLLLAVGHGHLGLTDAPGTAERIAALVG